MAKKEKPKSAPDSLFKSYYKLAKPGIVYGNLLAGIGGFLLASTNVGYFYFGLFVSSMLGLALVMASGCVFNNYIDRGIDANMKRTANRASVTGSISNRNIVLYGTVLGILGALILGFLTNLVTLGAALVGFVFYVVFYGISKRRSAQSTLVGAVSGAVPPVVGYCAVIGNFDFGALALFLILVVWQMPHFYAIALYRLDDYKAAKLPVLPIVYGAKLTKVLTTLYVVGFAGVMTLLTLFGYTGYFYLAIMGILSLWWLWICLQGFKPGIDDTLWAKNVFRFSLIILTAFCVLISVDGTTIAYQ